jgi:Spondin_N
VSDTSIKFFVIVKSFNRCQTHKLFYTPQNFFWGFFVYAKNLIEKMMKQVQLSAIFLCVLFAFVSCKKDRVDDIIETTPVINIDSTASYKIIIKGTWASPQHAIPPTEHFTQFIGLIHSEECTVYKLGALASKGVENVAEIGNSTVLKKEMDSLIAINKALSKFFLTISGIIDKDSTNISVNIKNSRISFESMLAPTPDWFVGIDSYNLVQNGKWVNDITIPVYGYDAGTEDGDVFGYANPATVPQQPISLMTPANASVIANGNAVIAPFASVRFVKL